MSVQVVRILLVISVRESFPLMTPRVSSTTRHRKDFSWDRVQQSKKFVEMFLDIYKLYILNHSNIHTFVTPMVEMLLQLSV